MKKEPIKRTEYLELRIVQIKYKGLYKCIVIDGDRESNKMLFFSESDSQIEAYNEAKEFIDAYMRNKNEKTMWS